LRTGAASHQGGFESAERRKRRAQATGVSEFNPALANTDFIN